MALSGGALAFQMVAKAHAIRWPITVQSASAVLLLQLWDLLALLVVYYACTRWGGPWLRDNWPAVAGPMAGALFVAEVKRPARGPAYKAEPLVSLMKDEFASVARQQKVADL